MHDPYSARPRSPIALMIDQATGFDPAHAKPPAPRDKEAETAALTEKLLAVADAAKAWHRARSHNRAARTKALHAAAQAWIEAGG